MGKVLPWNRKVHIVLDGVVSGTDKMAVLDFFRHCDVERSPLAMSPKFGILLNYSDFIRAVELGKRQRRKKCVGTQVSDGDFPEEQDFSDLFN